MQQYKGIQKSFLFTLFLVGASLCSSNDNNCTDSYVVSPNSSGSTICIDVFHGSSVIMECVMLSDFIRSVGSSQCSIEILFSQGKYTLTSYDIEVNTSLTLAALDSTQDVIITCMLKDRDFIDMNTTLSVDLNEDDFPSGHVTLSGISFEECAYSIRIDHVEKLTVGNCTFRDFKSPALDVYNCLDIEVTNSVFNHNNVTAFNNPFRGDSAGLSVGYHFQRIPPTCPILSVRDCEFSQNKAAVSSDESDQINKALNNNTYPARGGGMSMIIIEDYANITANIDNCVFRDNFAAAFGGAAYMIVSGQGTNHSVTFSNSKFINNKSYGGGGAMFLGYISTNLEGTPTVTEFNNVDFVGNTALSSGGVLVIQTQSEGNGNFAVFKSCNFTSNNGTGEGAAIVFGSLQNVQTRRFFHNSILQDCIFTNNTSDGGIVIAGFTNIESSGVCQFIDNSGPALRVTGALLKVKGNITFTGNRNVVSGKAALYITALGQVRLTKDSHLSFVNNHGSIGAAIRVELQSFPTAYIDTVDNPLCFLQYEDASIPPSQWENSIEFRGNDANLGSAVFASFLDFCSYNVIDNNTRLFDVKQFKHWPIFNFSVNYNHYHSIERENPTYYIQTSAVSIDDHNKEQILLRPNTKKEFSLTGLDQFGSPTFFVARIIDSDNSLSYALVATLNITESFEPLMNYSILYRETNVPVLLFNPNLVAINPMVSIITEYSLEKKNTEQKLVFEEAKEILIEVQNSYGLVYDVVEIQINTLRCLPGYGLQPSRTDPSISNCECVGAENDQFAVLDCEGQQSVIILRNGYWSGVSDGNDNFADPFLAAYPCPVTYCQCQTNSAMDSCIAEYNVQDINLQCHPPREGPLCGVCGNGTTVSVLRFKCYNDCKADDYVFYYATAILVAADSILIALVLAASIKFTLKLPNKLKGILFYIQTVYITTEYFPISFWNSRRFVLYLENLLSLYFPFDFCFLPNVPSVLSFIPRFLPVTILIVTAAAFFSFRKGRRAMWNGVWILTLLLYPSLVYTCVMILNCPSLPDTAGSNDVPRWFLDASVKCFSDTSHLILAILALLFLLVLVLVIPLMILLMVFERTLFVQERHPFLEYLLDAFKAGYKPKLHWMSCLELIKRLLLVGVVISTPGRTVTPIYIISFFFVIHIYFMPYEELIDNVLEAVILLNYIFLLCIRSCERILDQLDSYAGTMIPSNTGDEYPTSTHIIVFFSFFLYTPIIITLVVYSGWIAIRLWKYGKRRFIKSTTDRRKTMISADIDKCYYHKNDKVSINSSGKVIPVTDFVFVEFEQ